MSISMYKASIPTFIHGLSSLSAILAKGKAFAAAKKIDPAVLASARLAPDMFPLSRQVQIAGDIVKGCAARLSGVEIPKFEDNETTLEQLEERVAKTIAFLKTVKEESINGTEGKTIAFTIGGRDVSFNGLDYLLTFVIPNFYFHITATYAILRHNGVELGKADFLGTNR